MDVIRASELGEYYYCARSWWLRRVVGIEPTSAERRELGTVSHTRHGWLVATSQRLFWISLGLLISGVGLLIWSS